LQLRLNAS